MNISKAEIEHLKWVIETYRSLLDKDDCEIISIYSSIIKYLKNQKIERGNKVRGVLLYNVLTGSTVDPESIQSFDFDGSLPTIKFMNTLREKYSLEKISKG